MDEIRAEDDLPFPTHRGVKAGALSYEDRGVAYYFYRHHRGRGSAVIRVEAARRIGDYLSCSIDARRLRRIVARLVRMGIEIGVAIDAPAGYFWIETEEERKAVRNPLLNMAFSTLVHARSFDRDNIVAPLLEQLRLRGFCQVAAEEDVNG